MPTYWDDWTGVRKTVTPKYLDNPIGVRRNLSGLHGLNVGTPPPVNPNPNGSTGVPLMFFYPGSGQTTTSITNALGQSPQGWCIYIQRPQLSNMVSILSPYVRAGIHLQIGCGAPNDKPPDYPNGSLELMKGLGDRTTLAMNFWTTFCQNMNTVARANPNVIVKIAPIVEPETGYMTGSHDSTSAFYGEPLSPTGNQPTPTPASRAQTLAAIGRFHTVFYELAAEHAPLCVAALWLGGSLGRNAERERMFAPIPDAGGPDEILVDPYNNQLDLTERAGDTWRGFVNNWRLASGAHNAHYVRWGRPPMGLGETGISKAKKNPDGTTTPVYSDAQMVPWIESMFEAAVDLNLTQVNYFNSTGGANGIQQIIGVPGYPKATAAMSGEITQAKNALAAAA